MLNILKVGDNQTIAQIESADASFIVGTGGRTRRKLAAVSGTSITIIQDDSKTARVEINGDAACREKAYLYLKYLVQQKHGPVTIDVTPDSRDDLTIVNVPALCVGYITGKKGQGLRAIEEDSGTLMFFSRPEEECPTDSTPPSNGVPMNNGNSQSQYILAIFGVARNRRAAELRVMCYIEQKINGHFTKDLKAESHDHIEDLATDIVHIETEDLSYAVGKEGNTRRRLCASSGAIIEYVGNFAFIHGDLSERKRAKEYLAWLIAQRTSTVSVDTRAREDVTVVSIPQNVIGYVTGAKGSFLRRVEDETGTFIFIDENKGNVLERVLIFSRSAFGRQKARDFIERRMYEKLCGYADNKNYPPNGNGFNSRNMNGIRKTNGITLNNSHFDHPMKGNFAAIPNAFLSQPGISGLGAPNMGIGRRSRTRGGAPEHHISDKSSGKPAGLYGGNLVPFGLSGGALF
ncbi:unnamed protein product [Cryptosporidium hominis]|uniref:K-homology type RNA binding protein n=3 Tax=Cryptosporidium TaxID=5806 RepID=A0A0S4TC75_CRYHO|nr:hypothetical protein [Cryptosporidium hominis TU502]OLQ18559.1 hypothetical protein ChTU502y2012_411g0180 [Cryptosporidium hominis]PPA63965.1 KH domain protein [Cryptosporidium hominis]PPS97265.1 K-homology type RNA binding protein [Cryptosporidium hominis]CUV04071.1 unnamed protein product [Cryptosporidium hominis]|eukprot:PPS97265.1 K-homology type RNA binding protein [Cryptosporidium hominis]